MTIHKKPTGEIFAADAKSGELMEFPDVKRGWGITIDQTDRKPPMSWMNGVLKLAFENSEYLRQNGIAPYDNALEYPEGAITYLNDAWYVALKQTIGNNPATVSASWKKVLDSNFMTKEASTTQKGITQLSDSLTSNSVSLAATANAVKKVNDNKADKSDSLAGYGITDGATKKELLIVPTTTASVPETVEKPISLVSVAAGSMKDHTGFVYVRTMQYGSAVSYSQIAVPYANAAAPKMYAKHCYQGTETPWGRIDGADWSAAPGDTGHIYNKPSTLAAAGFTDWVVKTYSGTTNAIADAIGNGVHSYGAGATDAPTWADGSVIGANKMLQVGTAAWDSQIVTQAYGECSFIRSRRTANGPYQTWKRLDGADWIATEKTAGHISNKPTTFAALGIENIVSTDTVQTINGAKSFINTASFSSTALVGFSSWQNALQLSGILPVIGVGTFGIGFHRANKILYFMDIENQSYLATFTFNDNKATFAGALNAAGGLFKGTVEAAYSNVQIQAGTGLTGGGTLATTRALNIDKTTAAQLTAGTANKVVTSDVLAPFLNKAYSDVTASRSLGVNYTNNTGHEITVHVDGRVDGGASAAVAYVNGVVVNRFATISQSGISIIGTFSFAVPAGATYKVDGMGAAHSSAPYKWVEYR